MKLDEMSQTQTKMTNNDIYSRKEKFIQTRLVCLPIPLKTTFDLFFLLPLEDTHLAFMIELYAYYVAVMFSFPAPWLIPGSRAPALTAHSLMTS